MLFQWFLIYIFCAALSSLFVQVLPYGSGVKVSGTIAGFVMRFFLYWIIIPCYVPYWELCPFSCPVLSCTVAYEICDYKEEKTREWCPCLYLCSRVTSSVIGNQFVSSQLQQRLNEERIRRLNYFLIVNLPTLPFFNSLGYEHSNIHIKLLYFSTLIA